MFMYTAQRSRGITMMEVMIACAIVGILAVLLVPSFSSYVANNRLRSASESLYHDFNKARIEAIKQRQSVTVVFQTGTSWCYGITSLATCNCLVADSCTLGQISYSGFKDTSLSETGFTGDTTFAASRGDVNKTGTATLTVTGGGTISIILNQMGFPRICSSDVGGYKPCL